MTRWLKPIVWPVVILLLSYSARAADEQSLKTRFESEAIAGWTRLRQALDEWEGKATEREDRYFKPGEDPHTFVREHQYSRHGPLKKCETRNLSAPGESYIRCTNESYTFQLLRNNGHLKVIQYAPFKSKEEAEKQFDIVGAHVRAGLKIGSLLMPPGPEEPLLRVIDIRPLKYEGREMVRAQLEWAPRVAGVNQRKSAPGSAGHKPDFWVILDPKDNWIVYESHFKQPFAEWNETREFARLDNGLLFPRKIHESIVNREGKILSDQEWTFETPKRCEATASAFRLSAFGLHEPKQWKAAYGRADFQTWLLVNIALLAAIGTGFYWLKRRRRAS